MREIEDREAKSLGEGDDARTMVAAPITPNVLVTEGSAVNSRTTSMVRALSHHLSVSASGNTPGGRGSGSGSDTGSMRPTVRQESTDGSGVERRGQIPMASPRVLRAAGSMRDLFGISPDAAGDEDCIVTTRSDLRATVNASASIASTDIRLSRFQDKTEGSAHSIVSRGGPTAREVNESLPARDLRPFAIRGPSGSSTSGGDETLVDRRYS